MPDLGGIPALDVAIALAVLFFLLSTLCSMVNETVATILGWRAKTLEDAIRNMLGDAEIKRGWKEWIGQVDRKEPTPGASPPDVPRRDLTTEVFDHWRIAALVRDSKSSWRRRRRPSYLPPRALSLAIAERLAEGPQEAPVGSPPGPSPWQVGDDELLERVQLALSDLPEGEARQLLEKAATNAHGTLEGFRLQVERGFDDAMERASGWYKRKVQTILILLAAAIALFGNVDTVRVTSRLWNDDAMRSAVVAAANDELDSSQSAEEVAKRIDEFNLPVGWGKANRPDDLVDALTYLPGWLITIAAIGLGAPFWFDLLSRLARLRATGVPEQPRSLSDTAGTEPAAPVIRAAPSAILPQRGGDAPTA